MCLKLHKVVWFQGQRDTAGSDEMLVAQKPQCIINTEKQLGGAKINLPDKKYKK
jgi:hypothetical protein